MYILNIHVSVYVPDRPQNGTHNILAVKTVAFKTSNETI